MKPTLNPLPNRTSKPRQEGITMSMDKGLSFREAEDFIAIAGEYVDVIKLGFGTSYVTPEAELQKKLDFYRSVNIPFYFGGTLLEAFVIRGQFDDYCRMLDAYKVPYVEVSDGSIEMSTDQKLGYIRELAKNFTVLSEVGSKDSSVVIPPYKWVEMMQQELDAGAWKVIAEARESGTVGVFQKSGEARSGLIDEILHSIASEKIMWEAPLKAQQVWFLNLLGPNANLGNIAPNEVIPMETLRRGLRGDTFFTWLDK